MMRGGGCSVVPTGLDLIRSESPSSFSFLVTSGSPGGARNGGGGRRIAGLPAELLPVWMERRTWMKTMPQHALRMRLLLQM